MSERVVVRVRVVVRDCWMEWDDFSCEMFMWVFLCCEWFCVVFVEIFVLCFLFCE